MDEPGTLADVGMPVVGMNAYLGVDAILPALEAGADVVIGGRLADPVDVPGAARAPLRLGRGRTSQRLGAGTLVGHLMECGMQVTGGYFADPGVQGRAGPGALRLSDRRSVGRRQRRDHQACRTPAAA